MTKIQLTLDEEDYDEICTILDEYLEAQNDAENIKDTVKLINKIENNYKEV